MDLLSQEFFEPAGEHRGVQPPCPHPDPCVLDCRIHPGMDQSLGRPLTGPTAGLLTLNAFTGTGH